MGLYLIVQVLLVVISAQVRGKHVPMFVGTTLCKLVEFYHHSKIQQCRQQPSTARQQGIMFTFFIQLRWVCIPLFGLEMVLETGSVDAQLICERLAEKANLDNHQPYITHSQRDDVIQLIQKAVRRWNV